MAADVKNENDERIDWHSAFYDALRLELIEDKAYLEFEQEHLFNVNPLRADVVVIKKPANVELKKNIAKIFRGHNIIEFKSPEDHISVSDYIKTLSYPCIYQQELRVSYTDVTLTLIETAHPTGLLKFFRDVRKFQVEEKYPGVYVVTGELFPLQVIESKRLSEEDNFWLKNLSDKLKR